MPHIPNTDPNATSVGKPFNRIDGRLKVTGQARYAAEAPVQNVAYAVMVSSTIARGEVKSFDIAAAQSSPGVLAILTPENMPKQRSRQAMFGESRLPLSDMKVQYAGQYVAVAVADTLERAQRAAALIQVTYAPETPAIDIHDPKAKVETARGGFGGPLQLKRGDMQKALAEDGLTHVQATYVTPVETHNPMEMCATVAAWDGPDKLTVWDATQGVSNTRDALATAFGLPAQNVRVFCPYVGGGFGCKGADWPHTFLTVTLAKVVGRPVKLMLTRQQMFIGCGHRPTTEQTMTLAAAKDGTLKALGHATAMHGSYAGDHVESCGSGTSQILYAVPNLDISHTIHRVDVAPPTFMRAPGETPGMFALESAMDEMANALGMDPVQFRVINHADKNPQTGQPWSSKHLKECYQLGAEKFGWAKRTQATGSMRAADGRPMGWGMATATYPGMRFPGTARIRLMPDGHGGVQANGAAATQDLGTGTWTIGTQMTASLVGLPVEKVQFHLGDSDLPSSGVSGGSTTAASVGQALSEAANALRASLLKLAQETQNSPLTGLKPYQVVLNGNMLVSTDSPARSVPIAPLIARSGKPYIEGVSAPSGGMFSGGGTGQPMVHEPQDDSGEDYNANARKFAVHSFGAHFVEVVVDDPVPMVHVTRVVSVMDVGRVLNPKLAHSQVIGGVVMGIGMALMEETLYDPNTARPVTSNFADYPVCVNPDIHTLEAYFVDVPDTHFNAMGCRGVGEIGITGVAAAVANAIYHATGKRVRDLPITPDKLL